MTTPTLHPANQPGRPAQPGRTLLLACGNTLRGDDGVGWRIACAVEQQPCTRLTVLFTHQLLPEFAQDVSYADTVVFVDCSADTAAGTISTIPVEPAKDLPRTLTHHLDPAALLKLSLDLYAHAPARALAVTVGGESFALTDHLSKIVQAAVPKALKAVRNALQIVPVQAYRATRGIQGANLDWRRRGIPLHAFRQADGLTQLTFISPDRAANTPRNHRSRLAAQGHCPHPGRRPHLRLAHRMLARLPRRVAACPASHPHRRPDPRQRWPNL
jgi:hydrogenase maturation protease